MTVTIETATSKHAAMIARIMSQVWPDEAVSPPQITLALAASDHVTYAASTADGQVVGFVDGFLTTAQDGTRRWEVDLLAVAPDYRGQKIGQRLIAATEVSARQHSATLLRALIQTENTPSQIAFQRCGYQTDNRSYILMVSNASPEYDTIDNGAHLIPVTTMRYNGLWLEGNITVDSLKAAQTERTRRGLDIAGVLIASTSSLHSMAEAAGYMMVSHFNWWQKSLT